MTLGIAAPVGDSICLRSQIPPDTLLPDHLTQYFQSGTAALAAALLLVKSRQAVSKPNVVIPAYCCPDLVAACLYAGVEIRAADTRLDAPFYCTVSLSSMFDSNTIAVICVNFCGIHESVDNIKKVLTDNHCNAVIIEDWAQFHPANNSTRIPVDGLAIRSFGKGKPASILTAGAVVYSPEFSQHANASWSQLPIASPSISRLKAAIFNIVLTPEIYALAIRSSLISPGRTVFHPLATIVRHRQSEMALLASNISAWQSGPTGAQKALLSSLASAERFQAVAAPGQCQDTRLLRIPVTMADKAVRAAMLRQGAHLGISAMYQQTVDAISGVPNGALQHTDCKNAVKLAERLLTIPCHSRLRPQQITELIELITGSPTHD